MRNRHVRSLTTNTNEESHSFTLTAETGKWSGAALRKLPKTSTLAVKLVATGPITFSLFDEESMRAFPTIQSPLISGEAAEAGGFSTEIPDAGDYYLVIDNRAGGQSCRVKVEATISVTAPPPLGSEEYIEFANRMLESLSRNLVSVFDIDSLNIRTCRESKLSAAVDHGNIVLGVAPAMLVFEVTREKAKATSVLLFWMFQALARVLLDRSGIVDDKNHEQIDELGTALMVMFSYQREAETQADFIAHDPGGQNLANGFDPRDRHPLTVPRARCVLAWLTDHQLVARWHNILLPGMRTEALRQLSQQPPPWTSRELLRQELERRNAAENGTIRKDN